MAGEVGVGPLNALLPTAADAAPFTTNVLSHLVNYGSPPRAQLTCDKLSETLLESPALPRNGKIRLPVSPSVTVLISY